MEKKQEESPFAGMSMEELVKKMIEHTKELYQNCGIEPVAEVGEQRYQRGRGTSGGSTSRIATKLLSDAGEVFAASCGGIL